MQPVVNNIARTIGLSPMDFLTLLMTAWAIFDIWKYIPRWHTLDSGAKGNVRLVLIAAALGLVISITMHVRGQMK